MTTMDVALIPGLCPCGEVGSSEHACPHRSSLPPEPPGHAMGLVHPAPVPGCIWCPSVPCPCGEGCADPGECRRRWAGSETTWREDARRPAFTGAAAYEGWS